MFKVVKAVAVIAVLLVASLAIAADFTVEKTSSISDMLGRALNSKDAPEQAYKVITYKPEYEKAIDQEGNEIMVRPVKHVESVTVTSLDKQIAAYQAEMDKCIARKAEITKMGVK